MTTKKKILSLLQREPQTVAQLCEYLGVTRNAVNVQIKQLEAEGLVRRGKFRQRSGVGKPVTLYEAAPGSEDVASNAYKTFLLGLLAVLKERPRQVALSDALEHTGRRLAKDAGLDKPTDFETGLRAAMAVADSLGASTEAITRPDGVMVRNYSCPVSSAVRVEPGVCRAMASFFSEATGRPAAEHCLRKDRLLCQYLIKRRAAPKTRRSKVAS